MDRRVQILSQYHLPIRPVRTVLHNHITDSWHTYIRFRYLRLYSAAEVSSLIDKVSQSDFAVTQTFEERRTSMCSLHRDSSLVLFWLRGTVLHRLLFQDMLAFLTNQLRYRCSLFEAFAKFYVYLGDSAGATAV